MSARITIPLSLILFPITLPIALVRVVVAVVVAVIIAPLTLLDGLVGDGEFTGYAHKYTILEAKKRRLTCGTTTSIYQTQKVRVHPGFIPYIAGAKPKIKTLWTSPFHEQFLEKDGKPASAHFIKGIEKVEYAKRKAEVVKRTQQQHLFAIRNSLEVEA